MPPQDPAQPHEIPQDPVEIRQHVAIAVQDALVIATEESFPIGKSTLQRWAKTWAEQSATSPVKCVLVTNRSGSAYRLDCDDFKAWLFDQKQNLRPGETPQDPVMPREAPRDTARPHQTLRVRGPARPDDAPSDEPNAAQNLRDENMQLKIDVEVRKQLLNQAAGEIHRQRDQIEGLLRENGALSSQVLQLSAPASARDRIDLPPPRARDLDAEQGSPEPTLSVDNPTPIDTTPL